MKDNFNNDNLEAFFSKELRNDLQMDYESDGWDMPSDKVWGNIEPQLAASKTPFRFWKNTRPWMSIAASLLFITIAYQSLNYNQAIDDLQHQINNQADNIASIQTTQTDNYTNKATYQNSILSATQNQTINQQEKVTSKTVNQKVGVSVATTKATQTNFAKAKTVLDEDVILAEISNGGFIPIETISVIKNQNVASTQLADLPILNANKLGSESKASSLLPISMYAEGLSIFAEAQSEYEVKGFYKTIEPLKQKKNLKQWYAGIFYGPSWFSNKMKGDGADALKSLADQQIVKKSGFKTGINIGYQLSDNWSVESGLAFSKSKQTSEHNLNFTYTPDENQLNENGELEAVYAAKLNTSFGDLPTDIRLTHNPNRQIEAGTPIAFKLQSQQQVEMLQVPVSLKYSMGKGPWTISLLGGAMANIVVDKMARLSPPPYNHSTPDMRYLKHRDSNLQEDRAMQNINKFSCSLTGGLALDYEMLENVRLSVQSSYAKGVTPIYEDDDSETELLQASLMVGLNYYF